MHSPVNNARPENQRVKVLVMPLSLTADSGKTLYSVLGGCACPCVYKAQNLRDATKEFLQALEKCQSSLGREIAS